MARKGTSWSTGRSWRIGIGMSVFRQALPSPSDLLVVDGKYIPSSDHAAPRLRRVHDRQRTVRRRNGALWQFGCPDPTA